MAKRVQEARRIGRLASTLLVAGLAACAVSLAQQPQGGAAKSSGPAVTSTLGSYLAGHHAQHEHDYGAAAEYYGRALAADPGDFELLNKTFVFNLTEGRIAEATVLAQRIHQSDGAAPLPNLVLGLDALKTAHYDEALAEAKLLPRDGIQRFVAPFITAWAKEGQGDHQAALASLAELHEVQGFAAIVDFHTAFLADYAGRGDEAEADYKKVVGAAQRSVWRSVDALGSFYEHTDRWREAQALYQRFAAENRDSDLVAAALARLAAGEKAAPRIASPAEGAAEALFDLASLLNQTETADLALIYGRLALDLKPGFPLAQLLVADILESAKRYGDALAMDQTIAAPSPFNWSARLRAAGNLDALDRTDEAIAALQAMAAERPDRLQPVVQLGDLLSGKKRYGEAVAAYDAALARVGAPEPRYWSVFYSRGVALERAGDWPRAEADFLRALSLQPEQPMVLNYLGYSWIDKGMRLNEALKMIEHAVELRPNDGNIVDSLGWANYRLGNFDQATLHLEHAVELRPGDPTINDHLGDAYWQVGRLVEARNQWRRALQFGPEADEAKTIDAKLDRGLAKPAGPPNAAQGG
jgi:tetratricopeptide (TPR) repeat protein